jgi:hypothetical protein
MKRALIYTIVTVAMIVSIAMAGIFGPLIVSAMLSLAAKRYQQA